MNLDSLFITNGIHKSKLINKESVEEFLKLNNVTANYFQRELTW